MLSPLIGGKVQGNFPVDSSVFLTIAKGIVHGKIPYLDFFDHKGPLLYLISAFGLFFGGFRGVWFIELIFMITSVFFAYKTARFFADKLSAFLGTAFSFVLLTAFFNEFASTEEYVLPFIFISLYIFTKYFFARVEPSRIQISLLGACFGISLLLRPNMFAVWAAFCLVIFIQSIMQKQFMHLVNYILFFLIGILIAATPVYIYLSVNHALVACIDQCLIFNGKYTGELTIHTLIENIYSVCRNTFFWLPILTLLIFFDNKKNLRNTFFYIAYFASFVLTIVSIAISGRNYPHYSMVMIPLFVPPLSFCIEKLYVFLKPLKSSIKKNTLPLIIICLILAPQLFHALIYVRNNLVSPGRKQLVTLGKIIEENTTENDAITVFGNSCIVYLLTNRDFASKYIYQSPIGDVDPEIAISYQNDICNGKPKIIVIPKNSSTHYRYLHPQFTSPLKQAYIAINDMLDREYEMIYEDVSFEVFKYRDEK
jgi:hypothetical protein